MRRLAALASIPLVACSAHQVRLDEQAPATFASEPGGYEYGVVARVVDGDTIEVEIMEVVPGPGAGDTSVGQTYDVRLLGIDTPESVRPGTPVECFGGESSAATTALLQSQEVRLVKDVEEVDRYDRLLRYVYMGDEMANARLVLNGYAAVYTYPPNIRHAEFFVELQRQARDADSGLWAPAACNGEV
ncbi:MAG: thermonuclease family protein [Gaiellales bacterium]